MLQFALLLRGATLPPRIMEMSRSCLGACFIIQSLIKFCVGHFYSSFYVVQSRSRSLGFMKFRCIVFVWHVLEYFLDKICKHFRIRHYRHCSNFEQVEVVIFVYNSDNHR